jgi:hypothetical protein
MEESLQANILYVLEFDKLMLIFLRVFFSVKYIIMVYAISVADRLSMNGFKRLAAYMISLKIDDKNVVDTYVAAVSKLPVIGKLLTSSATWWLYL